jgi:protein SCO1/2
MLILAALALPALSQTEAMPAVGAVPNSATKPAILDQVGIEQRLNQQLPLDLVFRDETGKTVHLGDYFGQKPVILALVYYNCPMLCTETLNGLTSALSVLKFDVGREFNVVTVSFNPRETPQLAAAKKRTYLNRYGRPGAEQGWHFLTGDQPSIDALTRAAGFHYQWDPNSQQYAHATGIMVVTPQGKLAQYYYGVEFSPRDLRLGLIQASQNQIGTLVDQVLLYCYHYDPATGKYGAVILNVLRVAGVITLVFLGGFVFLLFRLGPKHKTDRAGVGRG